ncbi:MAG TPA: cupin domain-containing protein [Gaiellaceae bacterium]|nr:cupin domain-containing protein [Gaiellaceae bacterium]
MKRIEFSGERAIERFGSSGALVRRLAPEAHVVVIELEPGGLVGRHPAASAQLFAVVSGSGWVSGDDGLRKQISAGEAVLWEAGEEHESGSDEGMTVLVVEADAIDA